MLLVSHTDVTDVTDYGFAVCVMAALCVSWLRCVCRSDHRHEVAGETAGVRRDGGGATIRGIRVRTAGVATAVGLLVVLVLVLYFLNDYWHNG